MSSQVTIIYGAYALGTRRRRRHGQGGSAITSILTYNTGILQTNDVIPPFLSPGEQDWNDAAGNPHHGSFAFLSISGGVNEPCVSFDRFVFPEVRVTDGPIRILVFYIETGGVPIPGGYGNGVWIDAFDIDAGDFNDNDFVNISPDSSLSPFANEEGVVPTDNADETAIAFNELMPQKYFTTWRAFLQMAQPTANNLFMTRYCNDIAFAFYKNRRTDHSFNIGELEEVLRGFIMFSDNVLVDGGGWVITYENGKLVIKRVPGWNPIVKEIRLADKKLVTALKGVLDSMANLQKLSKQIKNK